MNSPKKIIFFDPSSKTILYFCKIIFAVDFSALASPQWDVFELPSHADFNLSTETFAIFNPTEKTTQTIAHPLDAADFSKFKLLQKKIEKYHAMLIMISLIKSKVDNYLNSNYIEQFEIQGPDKVKVEEFLLLEKKLLLSKCDLFLESYKQNILQANSIEDLNVLSEDIRNNVVIGKFAPFRNSQEVL